MSCPSTPRQFVNSQQEPGGKSGSKHECKNDILILILPVWEFDVHITSSMAKNIVRAHSAVAWGEIERLVLKNLDGVMLPVQLAYRVSGDIGKMSYLKDNADWKSTLARIDSKVPLARRNAVSIEIRNLVRIISTYQRLAHVK